MPKDNSLEIRQDYNIPRRMIIEVKRLQNSGVVTSTVKIKHILVRVIFFFNIECGMTIGLFERLR